MRNGKIVIGTRGSALALWQARWVEAQIRQRSPSLAVEITVIKTTGDRILDSPLSTIGGKGIFTKEIENRILDGSVDLAVHSLKDVPTVLPEGLALSAVCEREDVRDVFVSHPGKPHRSLDTLPAGAVIATGSLRRKSQILSRRPDLTIVDVRGNLNTRLEKLGESSWDGMILARAGVVRLGWEGRISEVIPTDIILPAAGQGALALETREDDEAVMEYVTFLDHRETRFATTAERSLLRHLEGGCQIPLGVYGRIEQGTLVLEAAIGSLDGKKSVRGRAEGRERPELIGVRLASDLLDRGGRAILEEIRRENG